MTTSEVVGEIRAVVTRLKVAHGVDVEIAERDLADATSRQRTLEGWKFYEQTLKNRQAVKTIVPGVAQ